MLDKHHRAARAYAERMNWSVFPCAGKVPAILGGGGCKAATTDLSQIDAWWRAYPGANIGIATGKPSGVWALDVDGRPGATSLSELEAKHGALPATLRQITGGGGEHYLFADHSGAPLRNRARLLPGLDVRADGGYIIAAPSIHPDTGHPYAWHKPHHPLSHAIANAPAWLTDLVLERSERERAPDAPLAPPIDHGWGPRPGYAQAALDHACREVAFAPVGTQDHTLNREAYTIGRLVAAGYMPGNAALTGLEQAAMQMTNGDARRPWRKAEVREKLARAFADASRRPREPLDLDR